MILGLDVSTSCTGWCIIDRDAKLVRMGYIKLSKISSVFEKAKVTQAELGKLCEEFSIDDVFIEENLQAFRPGFSSAKTLISLSRFNGIVSYLCEQIFETEPRFINVNAARKIVGLKIVRKSKGGMPTKHQVLDWVSNQLEGFTHQWPIRVLKSGPRKGISTLEDGCYDMADAFVIAQAGLGRSEQLC